MAAAALSVTAVRTSSGVSLTPQGKVCVPYLTRIAELYRSMGRELERAG